MEIELRREGGIEWSVGDGVGAIVIDRPQRANALGLEAGRGICKAIREVVDAGPRVIRLTGRGATFCAGGDIQEFVAAGDRLAELVSDVLDPLLPAYLKLATAPCPVVTVLNGPVGGAGIGLALVGDFVLASTSMKLRTGYAAIGLAPDVGASYYLARRVGSVRAQRWLMTSDPIAAEACLAAGAVDELHEPHALEQAADALVHRLRHSAPESLCSIKRLCTGVEARGVAEHIAMEREFLEACARTADGKIGVRAFVERRKPEFRGL